MKYLKSFNESTSEFNNMISECQDILVELSDKDIKYRVYGYKGAKIFGEETYKDLIRIEVGEVYSKTVKLKDMDLMFEHLFSYMESEGFELGKDSYYENSNWEYHEACPECDSGSISPPNDLSVNGWKCNKCKHEGHQDDFQRPEHPVSKDELFWSIKQNYHIQFMSLYFYRNK